MKKENYIYLDHAATTPLYPEVLEKMQPYLTEYFANPSGTYRFAQKSRNAVETAREQIAEVIGAKPQEIYFTAGGSEADNWALFSAAENFSSKGKHIVTTKTEHHAVLSACRYLEKHGYEITYLDTDETGNLSLEKLKAAVRPDTILISVMTANNEIGTILPVAEIGAFAKERGILFHTDAVQAFGHIPIDVKKMNIDLLSASAHKINGPKGNGFLYIRTGVRLTPFLHGGSQERGKRAGTLDTAGIVGFGAAAELAQKEMSARAAYETALRDYAIDRIEKEIPSSFLNGDRKNRLPNNISFCFEDTENEAVLIRLDEAGICVSGGAACAAGALEPSHVLLAIGRSKNLARSAVRITISEKTTKEELDFTIEELKKAIKRIRGY